MRKITEFSGLINGITYRAIVRYNKEWEEYIVAFYINGVHQKNADYHDSDKQSAISCARYFAQWGNSSRKEGDDYR